MKTDFFKKNIWLCRMHDLELSNRNIAVIIALSFLTTATEVIGVGIFLPIFQFIRLNGNIDALVEDTPVWQYIVDIYLYFGATPSLLSLLFLSFSLFFLRQIFLFFRLLYVATVTQRLVQTQRNYLFDKYMDADTSYHDKTPLGSLVNVIIAEVQNAVSGIMMPLGLVVDVVMLFGYLIMLSLLSWQMTLLSIAAIILAGAVPRIWISKSAEVGRKLVNANILMSEFLVGRLRSPRLVRLSGTEDAEKNEFHLLTLSQRKQQIFSSFLHLKTDIAVEPLVIALSLVFLYFSYTVLHLKIEVIGLYLVIIMRLMPLAKTIIVSTQSVSAVLGAIEILESRHKAMDKSKERDSGIKHLNNFKKSILLNRVGYRYPLNDDITLKNITVEFKVNTMTAIVGPSGSGKSTLIDLLPLLRLPTEGVIKIDGENITHCKLRDIRYMISYAPQSPQIFNGTIKSHILYGKRDATNDEVWEAIRLSGAGEFINPLPQGIETIVGEDAINLSGGQRQRLDLARALVRKSPILILDEPTSNLDVESESAFKKALLRIRNETNTTIIIVTHRLESIADADQIIVINQGEVENTGQHVELLKQKGWYAKTFNL